MWRVVLHWILFHKGVNITKECIGIHSVNWQYLKLCKYQTRAKFLHTEVSWIFKALPFFLFFSFLFTYIGPDSVENHNFTPERCHSQSLLSSAKYCWGEELFSLEVTMGGLMTNLLLKSGSMLKSDQVDQFKLFHHRIRRAEEKGRNILLAVRIKARIGHFWLGLKAEPPTQLNASTLFYNPQTRIPAKNKSCCSKK